MRNCIGLMTLLTAGLACTAALAQAPPLRHENTLSAAELARDCRKDGGLCESYLTNVADMARDPINRLHAKVCLARREDYDRLRGVLIRYVDRHPRMSRELAINVIPLAYAAQFPCATSR